MIETDASPIDDLDDLEPNTLANWTFNFVLGLLGVAVLALAFLTLDHNEPRYLYNPWTYAVIVPFALVLIATVMSLLVSRFVRRSMQAAFLLSVLAHLLILSYISNIVIQSRFWPQLFDSLAQQRRQLKLENLQAKQYFNVSVVNRLNRRADHLRPVPTHHQPTEIPQLAERNNQLAASEVAQLNSPEPELNKATIARPLRRVENLRTPPSQLPHSAAPFSRSDLSQSLPEAGIVPSYELELFEPQLQASKADSVAARNRPSDQVVELESPTTLAPQPNPENRNQSTANLQRRTAESDFAPQAMSISNLPRSNDQAAQPTLSRQPISPSSPGNIDSPSAFAIAAEKVDARRSTIDDGASQALDPSSVTTKVADSQLANMRPLFRKQLDYQIPTPSDGALSSISVARSSAGGIAGPASRSSQPIMGSDSLPTASSHANEQLQAGTSAIRRSDRSAPAAALSPLTRAEPSGSSQWEDTVSFSSGLASPSPAQLAREGAGEANTSDVAGLYGADIEIQRAAVGLAGPQGPLPISASANSTTNLTSTLESSRLDLLAAREEQIQRTSASNLSSFSNLPAAMTGPEGQHASGMSTVDAVAPASLPRPQATGGASDVVPHNPTSIQRRDDLASSAPSSIEVDSLDVQINSSEAVSSTAISDPSVAIFRSRREGGNARLQVPQDFDVATAQGGLGLIADSMAGPLQQRRSSEQINISLPAFDLHQIARSAVGGRLSGATNVAMPTPAFQQRLDRLENRSPDTSIDPQTELAIERGLEFLAKHQRDDGSWRLQDFDTKVLIRSDTAATALALLAFQGAGYTHVQSKYATQVNHAIEFLANHQQDNGDLFIPQDPASNQNAWLYSHAIASLALCEAYGMTQDDRLRQVAQRAVDFMVDSQDPKRGGWRYRPQSGSDTSVTGWYMMALQSGRLAGLNVPTKTFDLIESFLGYAQFDSDQRHIYRYNPFAPDTPEQRHGLQPTAVMTSVGLLIRLYSGWRRENKEMIDGATHLLNYSPRNGTLQQSQRDTYYWYYATQVIFHMGGDYWQRWQQQLNPMLIKEQVSQGPYAGSWDPNEPVPDLWSKYGGRLYVTTMNLLSLEVSYRHLPLYGSTSK